MTDPEDAVGAHPDDAVGAHPGAGAGARAGAGEEPAGGAGSPPGTATVAGRSDDAEDAGRLLFRYVTGDEWREYRAIMGVFAGTFFSEFAPEDVEARLAAQGTALDIGTVGERLESLRRWGNLTVSSTTGTPGNLADYYRRRNRYLITRAGQEVHEAVEGILSRVDEVRDVSTGRLRSLLEALRALAGTDVSVADPRHLADLVRGVFDPHQAFTSEIMQFSAAVNQWQSRYDLSAEELAFFAQVLVGYVGERLDEIEQATRPIGVVLESLEDRVPLIVDRANRGLAARVEEAGLQGAVVVSRAAGSTLRDWEHLRGWFLGAGGRPARMDQLRQDAVAAVRSLTLNLIRLSRVGVGGSSRRADYLRLARILHAQPDLDAAKVVTAALGLHLPCHFGAMPGDGADPVAPSTPWWQAPPASVPVSLRARGDTTARGTASPIADRSTAQRLIRLRRQAEQAALEHVDAELLSREPLDGATVSSAALARFEQLVGRALASLPVRSDRVERADGAIVCTVERAPGATTAVSSPEGTLTLVSLRVALRPVVASTIPSPSPSPLSRALR